MKKIHFFIFPILLTLIGFLYKSDCRSEFCLFDGRGFPLGMNGFEWMPIVVNFTFFFLIYSIFFIKIENYKNKKNENKN